jgi:hypothetical protein
MLRLSTISAGPVSEGILLTITQSPVDRARHIKKGRAHSARLSRRLVIPQHRCIKPTLPRSFIPPFEPFDRLSKPPATA